MIWLACRGWKVTAVDFSPAAIDRGRLIGERHGLHVDWVVTSNTARCLVTDWRVVSRTAHNSRND